MIRIRSFAALCALVLAITACDPLYGPRFFNATSHEILLRVSFSDGYTWPVKMGASSPAAYTEDSQVTAIAVEQGGRSGSKLSGASLPQVPTDLGKPSRQLWVIGEDGVCVLPEREFHHGEIPKC